MKSTGLIVAAYFLGAIPTGVWLGKAWKGIDVRQHGSGNLGATNVFRVLGPGPGAVTLIIDMLKGFLPVITARQFFASDLQIWIAVGIIAILGHTASIFLGFRGGKGVATAAGVFAALLPLPFLIAIVTFLIVVAVSGYVSVGSMMGATALAAAAFVLSSPRPLSWMALVIAVFVVWMHRTNIERLKQGTENRFQWRRTSV